MGSWTGSYARNEDRGNPVVSLRGTDLVGMWFGRVSRAPQQLAAQLFAQDLGFAWASTTRPGLSPQLTRKKRTVLPRGDSQ